MVRKLLFYDHNGEISFPKAPKRQLFVKIIFNRELCNHFVCIVKSLFIGTHRINSFGKF